MSWRKAALEAGGSVKRPFRVIEARTDKGQMILGCYWDMKGRGWGGAKSSLCVNSRVSSADGCTGQGFLKPRSLRAIRGELAMRKADLRPIVGSLPLPLV